MNIWELIFLCFAFQGLVMSVFLFLKKSPSRYANTLWAVFLFLFSLNLIYNVLFWAYRESYFTIALDFVYLIPFSLYGPLFYLYVKTLTQEKLIPVKVMALHFIPTILVILNFSKYYGLSVSEKMNFGSNEVGFGKTIPIAPGIVYIGISLILLIYAFFTYRTIKGKFKNDFEMRLWLKVITGLFFLFGLSWILYFVLNKMGVLETHHDYVISFFMVALIGVTSYFGFNYYEVFHGKSLQKVFPLIKYEKSGLSKKVLQDFKGKLLETMETKGLHSDSELKLMDVANELNISRHHASQIINECFGMSFHEYINKYRIEEAEKLLMDKNALDLNITDIAYKSGFNNRMSFYNAFKKYIGITPSEYRNQNLAS